MLVTIVRVMLKAVTDLVVGLGQVFEDWGLAEGLLEEGLEGEGEGEGGGEEVGGEGGYEGVGDWVVFGIAGMLLEEGDLAQLVAQDREDGCDYVQLEGRLRVQPPEIPNHEHPIQQQHNLQIVPDRRLLVPAHKQKLLPLHDPLDPHNKPIPLPQHRIQLLHHRPRRNPKLHQL